MHDHSRPSLGNLVLLVTLLLSVTCCVGGPAGTMGQLHTPGQHVKTGFKFMEKNYLDDAQREFELAIQLDASDSSAHRGLGTVLMIKERYDGAMASMGLALEHSRTAMERARAHMGFIRVLTGRKGDGWVEAMQKHFFAAVADVPDLPEAYYWAGLAYKGGGWWARAEEAFVRVIDMDKECVAEARRELDAVRSLKRGPKKR